VVIADRALVAIAATVADVPAEIAATTAEIGETAEAALKARPKSIWISS
jgi:hypothetical protein